ncbi:MAG: hypothetical protein ACTSU5_12530 [Promethearchaeota archaeon]
MKGNARPLPGKYKWENVDGVDYVVIDEDLYVNPEIFNWYHHCDFRNCDCLCCDEGCWITYKEKWRVYEDIRAIGEYLKDIPDHPFSKGKWKYWEPKPEDDLFHTKLVPIPSAGGPSGGDDWDEGEEGEEDDWDEGEEGEEDDWDEGEEGEEDDWDEEEEEEHRCIFQLEDGRCAIHAYCLDNGKDWIDYKFNICVTFPLDIIIEDVTYVDFLQDHDLFLEKVDCLVEGEPEDPASLMKPVVFACKDVLVQRLGIDKYQKILELYREFTGSK